MSRNGENNKGGAPKGNTNGSGRHEWSDAIRYALANYTNSKVKRGQALKKIAKTVVERAMVGDKDAWQEVGNRLDGKPIQAVEAKLDTTITIVQMTFGSKPMRPCINGSTDTEQLDST